MLRDIRSRICLLRCDKLPILARILPAHFRTLACGRKERLSRVFTSAVSPMAIAPCDLEAAVAVDNAYASDPAVHTGSSGAECLHDCNAIGGSRLCVVVC